MRALAKRFATRFRSFSAQPVLEAIRGLEAGPDAVSQIQLMMTYRSLVEDKRPLPRFVDVGFRCNSQTDEDGILLYLFSVLGTANKTCVEVCAGDGIECNTANLILKHGWHGLLVDGDRANVERGTRYYSRSKDTFIYPPRLVHSWVTRDGINDLLSANGFSGEVDLLSLDLDGIDYWVWQSLEVINPRVVVLEYQDILGPERSWTVPYSDDFSASGYPTTDGMPNFAGASLAAFVKLGRQKGYRLVGVNRYGFNAFFVREGLGEGLLPDVEADECFGHPKVIWGMRERFPTVKDLPWVQV
jgi:hypothetical protein